MRAVFVRHNLNATTEVLHEFWAKRLLAIHFADIPSTDPDDYERAGERAGAKALRRLKEFCHKGAVVGAVYPHHHESLLVGNIAPESEVELYHSDHIYKTVSMKNVQEISYSTYPILLVQPKFGTITGWPSVSLILEAILSHEEIPWDVYSLHPSQLEVLCYEYLRVNGLISSLLMPIGRTLQDIDIWGLDKLGRDVLAQVTFSSQSSDISIKMVNLTRLHVDSPVIFFFGPRCVSRVENGVAYVSIEDVFDELANRENSPQRMMLTRMLRPKHV